MRRSTLFSIACLSATVLVGCSKPAQEGGATAGTAGTSGTAVASPDSNPAAPPVAAARSFLNAVRQGETEQAASMLTPLALRMTSENDLSFSPPGSATAQFSVVDAQMVDADKAVVETIWSDLDADGARVEESIAWALRLTDGRWRISGMAADVAEGQPPLVIDFENPLDLIEKQSPTTPGTQPVAAPQPKNPADQVARDPFQQPATR